MRGLPAARDQHAGNLVDDDRRADRSSPRRASSRPAAQMPTTDITIGRRSRSARSVGWNHQTASASGEARDGAGRDGRVAKPSGRSRSSVPAAIRGPRRRAAQRASGPDEDRSRRPRAISDGHSPTGREGPGRGGTPRRRFPAPARRSGPPTRRPDPRCGPSISTSWTVPTQRRPGAPRRARSCVSWTSRARSSASSADTAAGQRRRRRALLGGVDEAAHAVEARLVEEARAACRTPPRVSPGNPTSTVVAERRAGDRVAAARRRSPPCAAASPRAASRGGSPSSACWIGMSTYGARAPAPSFWTRPSVTCAGWR